MAHSIPGFTFLSDATLLHPPFWLCLASSLYVNFDYFSLPSLPKKASLCVCVCFISGFFLPWKDYCPQRIDNSVSPFCPKVLPVKVRQIVIEFSLTKCYVSLIEPILPLGFIFIFFVSFNSRMNQPAHNFLFQFLFSIF